MGVTEILAIIATVFKFAALLIERYKNTPAEKRRESLASMDKALELSKQKDLTDISTWMGGRL